MIGYGGPRICADCQTLMHEPTPECPSPYVCLSGPECADARCRSRRGIPEA